MVITTPCVANATPSASSVSSDAAPTRPASGTDASTTGATKSSAGHRGATQPARNHSAADSDATATDDTASTPKTKTGTGNPTHTRGKPTQRTDSSASEPKSAEPPTSDATADTDQTNSGTTTPTAPTTSPQTPAPKPATPATTVKTGSKTRHPASAEPAVTTPKAAKTAATGAPSPSTASQTTNTTATQPTNTTQTLTKTATATLATATETTSPTTQSTSAVLAPTTAPTRTTGPIGTILGALNHLVTQFTKQFLAPAPNTSEPFTPVVWALLGWVRRDLFNQAPTLKYNPTTTVQTGQTITGDLGATDPEGDKLTYTVTHTPQHGTVTIDQATGKFTYTPNDINYTAAQTDSFTVSVTDGNRINLLNLFQPRAARTTVDLTVLNPTVNRVIMNLPAGITNPSRPRFTSDGKTIVFGATPSTGGRQEIYQINVDGTAVTCVTCGVSTNITGDLQKPLPFEDGSGRILLRLTTGTDKYRYVVYEDGANGRQLVPLTTPSSPTYVLDSQREMKISPDGTHVLFSRLELGTNNYVAIIPIVGKLVRTDTGYEVDDATVVAPYGEGKSWTPDGKSVIIMGGQYDAGNVDAIKVDLATGNITRETAGLDYEENVFESPNEKWIVTGSTRGLDALTPMSRIQRPALLPSYIVGPVYTAYAADPINVSNQAWVVALDDELKRENGLPLIVPGDGYAGQSMPGWNSDGSAVAFWEQNKDNPTDTRMVIANLKYTTSVGGVQGTTTTPQLSSTLPKLSSYIPSAPALPPTGTYAGAGGGTAVVGEAADPNDSTRTIRTVTYTDYVNELGEVLNGTESTNSNASQLYIHYTADIAVTGKHTGSLKADATVTNRQTYSGYVTSDVDGDVQNLMDQNKIDEAKQNV